MLPIVLISAIEKIVQEKKISTKINYDVLKSLGIPTTPKADQDSNKNTVIVLYNWLIWFHFIFIAISKLISSLNLLNYLQAFYITWG